MSLFFRPSARILVVVLLVLAVLAIIIIRDQRIASLAWNTMAISALTCAISLPVALVVAFLLIRTDLPGRRSLQVLFAMMLVMPLYLQAAAWDAGFGRAGWLAYSQGSMNQPLLQGWAAVVWIHSMAAIPWAVLMIGFALRNVDRTWEEAALMDGTNLQVATRITAVQAVGAVGVAALWIFLMAASEMTVTDIYAVRTLAEEIYVGSALGDDLSQVWMASAPTLSLVLVLLLSATTILTLVAPFEVVDRSGAPRVFALGAFRWPLCAFLILLLLGMVGVPLGNLVYKAGLVVENIDAVRLRVWSMSHFVGIVVGGLTEFQPELCWSGLIGCAVGVTTLSLATALTWWAGRHTIRNGLLLLACAACLAIPGPLIGRMIIAAFNRPDIDFLIWLYDKTIAAPVVALTIRSLPLATLILWHAFRSLPQDMLDNASLDGVSRFQQLFWLAIPQRRSALALAWLVAFVLAVGDVTTSILVVPPGMELVPIRVFGMVHYGVEDRLAGLCLLMVALFAALGFVFLTLLRLAAIDSSTKRGSAVE